MKQKQCYPVICRFQETAPTLQEKMRTVLQNAVREREPIWTPRK